MVDRFSQQLWSIWLPENLQAAAVLNFPKGQTAVAHSSKVQRKE